MTATATANREPGVERIMVEVSIRETYLVPLARFREWNQGNKSVVTEADILHVIESHDDPSHDSAYNGLQVLKLSDEDVPADWEVNITILRT